MTSRQLPDHRIPRYRHWRQLRNLRPSPEFERGWKAWHYGNGCLTNWWPIRHCSSDDAEITHHGLKQIEAIVRSVMASMGEAGDAATY
ncbi:hypothetical protein ACNKHP_05385 [Shigella boydii]